MKHLLLQSQQKQTHKILLPEVPRNLNYSMILEIGLFCHILLCYLQVTDKLSNFINGPLPLANSALFTYVGTLAMCCTRQSLQQTLFTKMVNRWYLISDHRQSRNGVGTIKKGFSSMHRNCPNWSLEEEQESIFTVCLWSAWLWHSRAVCWGILALER